jgi:hypothetical protein
VCLPPINPGARLPSPFFISRTERISLPCSLGLGPATPPYAQARPARFDTFRHPTPNRINALRNESPLNPAHTLRHFSTPHAQPNQRPAKRIPRHPAHPPGSTLFDTPRPTESTPAKRIPGTRPTRSTLFDTPRPTESTPCETNPPALPPRPFDTSRHPTPTESARCETKSPATRPARSTLFDTPRPTESTRCETKSAPTAPAPEPAQNRQPPSNQQSAKRIPIRRREIGRNAPCPCGFQHASVLDAA